MSFCLIVPSLLHSYRAKEEVGLVSGNLNRKKPTQTAPAPWAPSSRRRHTSSWPPGLHYRPNAKVSHSRWISYMVSGEAGKRRNRCRGDGQRGKERFRPCPCRCRRESVCEWEWVRVREIHVCYFFLFVGSSCTKQERKVNKRKRKTKGKKMLKSSKDWWSSPFILALFWPYPLACRFASQVGEGALLISICPYVRCSSPENEGICPSCRCCTQRPSYDTASDMQPGQAIFRPLRCDSHRWRMPGASWMWIHREEASVEKNLAGCKKYLMWKGGNASLRRVPSAMLSTLLFVISRIYIFHAREQSEQRKPDLSPSFLHTLLQGSKTIRMGWHTSPYARYIKSERTSCRL